MATAGKLLSAICHWLSWGSPAWFKVSLGYSRHFNSPNVLVFSGYGESREDGCEVGIRRRKMGLSSRLAPALLCNLGKSLSLSDPQFFLGKLHMTLLHFAPAPQGGCEGILR